MAEQDLKRHPVLGGFWGIPTGLGLGLLAVNSQIFSLSITTLVAFAVLGIVLGAVWASFGPAKKPKDAPPIAAEAVPEPIAASPVEAAPEPMAAPPVEAADDPGPAPTQF